MATAVPAAAYTVYAATDHFLLEHSFLECTAHRRAATAATIDGEHCDRDALAAPLTRGHPRRGHPRRLAAVRSHRRRRRRERPGGGRCRGRAVGAGQFRPALCMLYTIRLTRTPSPNWILTRELR
jgi:hypothetical protein